jgi:RNA polymerase sigma-70 factor (ECF subfamily)
LHSEEDLVRRAQKMEPEAFGQLYEAHFDRVYRYMRLRVRNQADAEDLTQQVFLKALEHIGSYRYRGMPFAAWLFRIAHNQVVDHWKKKSRDKGRVMPLDQVDEAKMVCDDDPASLAERAADIAVVAAACDNLSPGQREVISLRFAGGLSVAETARAMRKSEGAVKVLQHAALVKLRRILCPQEARDG